MFVSIVKPLKHLVPWWLYVGRERRVWVRFKRKQQKLEIYFYHYAPETKWAQVAHENDLFGIWD